MVKKVFISSLAMLIFTLAQGQVPEEPENTPVTKSTKVWMEGNDIVFTLDGAQYRYKMVYVSGGNYQMGAPESDGEAYSWEKPQHNVTVSGFYMGQTEVTQALWKAVMGSNQATGRATSCQWRVCHTTMCRISLAS